MFRKRGFLFIVLFFFCVSLAACQGSRSVSTNPATSLGSEKQIAAAVEKKEYDKVQEFIKKNTEEEGKKELVGYAISSLVKTDDKKNLKFLQETLQDWIQDKKIDHIVSYIGNFENEVNKQNITNIKTELDSYRSSSEQLAAIEKESIGKTTEKNTLIKQFPIQISVEHPNMFEFYGTFVKKNSYTEYTVVRNPNEDQTEYILIQKSIPFINNGSFQTLVVSGETKNVTQSDGTVKKLQVIYEIPQSEKNEMIKIIEVSRAIYHLEMEKGKYDDALNNSEDAMNKIAEHIFNAEQKDVPQGKDDNSTQPEKEWLTIKDHKFYLFGLTLGDSKEKVIELLGEPQMEDSGGMYNLGLTYGGVTYYFMENGVESIQYEINEDTVVQDLLKGYTGDKYMSREGTLYFHEPETDCLLMVRVEEGKLVGRINFADGNFKYHVNENWINPMW